MYSQSMKKVDFVKLGPNRTKISSKLSFQRKQVALKLNSNCNFVVA